MDDVCVGVNGLRSAVDHRVAQRPSQRWGAEDLRHAQLKHAMTQVQLLGIIQLLHLQTTAADRIHNKHALHSLPFTKRKF